LARQKEKIYRRRRPLRTLLRVLGVSLLTIILLLVVVFFWFQRYIVYTPDGIRLDIPFLRGILYEIPEDAQDEPFPFLPPWATPTDPDLPVLPDGPTLPWVGPMRGVLVSGETLAAGSNWDQALENREANAILVAMNDETGRLWWASEVDTAIRFALYGEGQPGPILETIDPEFGRSALLFGFHNELMATRNPPVALDGAEGWLDPRNLEMRDYIMDLALELGRLGFDEIVLVDFTFPPNYAGANAAVIVNFLRALSQALATLDVRLSVMVGERDWYDPYGEALPLPSVDQLLEVVDRFYTVLEPETLADAERHSALMAAVETTLGIEIPRFVPVGSDEVPRDGNWVVRE